MKFLADINLLLYAHHEISPLHAAASEWLKERMVAEGLALPWTSLLGFLRLSVKKGVVNPPLPVDEAWSLVQALLDTQRIWIVEPTTRHRQTLSKLLPLVSGQGNDITDAHLAALAIEHNLILATADSGFARFEPAGLRWRNPLID